MTNNERFIPKEKMSKKQKKEIDRQGRTIWNINPITRTPKNSKAYDRNKEKNWRKQED